MERRCQALLCWKTRLQWNTQSSATISSGATISLDQPRSSVNRCNLRSHVSSAPPPPQLCPPPPLSTGRPCPLTHSGRPGDGPAGGGGGPSMSRYRAPTAKDTGAQQSALFGRSAESYASPQSEEPAKARTTVPVERVKLAWRMCESSGAGVSIRNQNCNVVQRGRGGEQWLAKPPPPQHTGGGHKGRPFVTRNS